jgi:hypothetical protein
MIFVLKRPHPVPISHQPIKAQADPARGLAIEIKTLIDRIRISRRPQRVGPTKQQHRARHANHDYQREADSLHAIVFQSGVHLYLKFRRLKTSVAAARITAI